ncbi:hypothetical protein PHYBLDRAFT_69007 [Phycomyces blakesleeanus NRRL 1555(-)]|uniref:Uncharacterized protein n=1 Tax=Phycomyces blakesleeanus (strain ATCC 8743b / DSM 1359 / FGSC 10004 / NBRC 33097 / NRRL 1555) TaxID=763407 RepID=A0A163D3H7_PHYB8|nr:hypothetical protein PHYBLDRAFT_69007 [Phycomyces blakesleeanus NRRL 1555(-)]OAD68450.1 hypothetical protein PHYBLDRAFT_69007 [Phycomyces blakesleeanus NRRL 1555(-)]|eukprot:XP_018286490.1 hypothetical protein PHYBLDRAFT_69007 [Phycomyces blakesleeanus NRRL 1555(-)]
MKISNLITQTFENSVNEDRAESVNHSEHIFNFTGFDHQGNQARNNAISRSFTALKYNNELYSGEQYDLREFILEETRNRPAGSMDVDVEFGQDVPTDIETPLEETGCGYFCICNTVNHADSLSQYESEISDESNESNKSNKSKLDETPRVPHYEPRCGAEAASLELFSMLVENNVSRNVFDKCVKMMNKYMTESAINSLMSYYKMDTLLRQEYTVRPVTHDMCKEGCTRFEAIEAGQHADEEEQCSHCNSQRFQCKRGTLIPVQTFQVVSLSEQLRFKLGNSQERTKMEYSKNRLSHNVSTTRSDILDGNAVHRLVQSGIVSQNDILVTMFID